MNLTKPQKLIYDMEKFTGGTIAIVCGSMLIQTDKSVDEMKKAVNELYRLNDALRIRVSEENGQPYQYVTEYKEQDIEVLSFNSKEELDSYASRYAKEPLDFYGSLCDIKIVVLSDKKGVLAKLHHFISDAWTLSLIGTQFNKILNGDEVQVYSYADYVTAEEKYIDSKRYAKDKDYFISQFKKCDEVTYISEKQARTFEAKRATFVIDIENTSKILAYTKEKEVSAFSLFMSVVATYMNRVKMNADKFYIGTAVLNRNGAKEQNTMGMFINTAPILVELNNESSFVENLNAVELSALSVLRHQKYNYGDLLEELRNNHKFNEKLYDIMLSYQNAKVLGDEVETTWYHSGMQTESLQIHIDDRDDEGIFRIHYDYLAEKFTEHEIEKMHEHICNLLFSAIKDDGKKLYELDILSQEEKNTLLFDFNDTAVDYPRDKCVHQLFEEQVEKNPDKVAVVACDKTLTYKELNEEANRIAHSLIEKGIGRGDIVAFMLPRRSYLISTMLGILKSGAAYMPIDPDYPQDRIEYMLFDSGAKFCVTDKNISELLDNSNVNNPNAVVSSEDKCYCIYTSGSTGKPKGTLIKHKNLVNLLSVKYIFRCFEKVNTIALLTTICFDVASQEIFTALLGGLSGFLFSTKNELGVNKVVALISEKKIDVLFATPTYFDFLTSEKENAQVLLSTLKMVILAGEQFYLNDNVHDLADYHDTVFQNQYGPAETHVVTVCDIIPPKFSKCVHQLFEEQVEKTPDKVAVIACDKTLTYKKLNEEANKIAHSLIEKGIGRGDIVAFMLPRRSYLISTMLGILKSGAAYMPIDPDYPQNRTEYMLTESRANYCVNVMNFEELIANSNVANPNKHIDITDVFCALHTSGSTGNPKMSLLKHGCMVNFTIANSRFWQDIDTVVSATIVTFDAFQMDAILSLALGKNLVLANEDEIYNQILFEKLFEHSDSNMFFSTPTKIKNYIECSADKMYIKKIKNLVIGGEVFSEQLLDSIKENSHETKVYNIYGPTETTICVLVDTLTMDKVITIGKPIANTQIYIVDKYMKPVPIGVTGELCIAGDCVGAGYLNRSELNSEKFIDNPFGEGKMYKTGDLAYWREDGNIAYVGRNDFQVKIRGLRIELGEIENAISSVDGINMSVVVVRKNSEGRQLICAFYTGEEKSAQEIKSIIGEKLPKYMLPHLFTHLDEMPLTSSGKISRKTLPEIDFENIETSVEYVAPETKLQKKLCELIEVVLGVNSVGTLDDFFDLGGDSLKAIELVSQASEEGIYFNIQNLFDHSTVEELSKAIEKNNRQTVSFNNLNFDRINNILSKNKVGHIATPKKCDVGNVLVAGATGYLGIHVLANYLDNDSGIAYCLVRGKDKEESKKRLNKLLDFYFKGKFDSTHRIEVICADLQKHNFGLTDDEYNELIGKVDTVINCAASVKHYGTYQYFYEVNVESTKRLIQFCKKSNAKLIHTSTLSVSGNSFEKFESQYDVRFGEDNLYIGQPLENVYARSKFEAEKLVLEAMCDGIEANIFRVGFLSNRYSDGVFQINYESNAFLKRLLAIIKLGIIPKSFKALPIEFTPVDLAAEAIMTITRNFSNVFNTFHICNINTIEMHNLIAFFKRLGIEINVVDDDEFYFKLKSANRVTEDFNVFEAFANDFIENNKLDYSSKIVLDNQFSVDYLKKLQFEWNHIDFEYIKKYIEYFRKIGFLK